MHPIKCNPNKPEQYAVPNDNSDPQIFTIANLD